MKTEHKASEFLRQTVAILTPALNEGSHLPQAYTSLISQTSNSWQWLVSDNNSDDNTTDFLESLRSDSRVKWIRHKKRLSAEENWQSLIDWVKALDCQYIMFLAGDDWLPDPDALKDMIDGLNSSTGGSVIGRVVAKSSPEGANQNEMFTPRAIRHIPRWQVFKLFLSDWGWSHLIYACYKRDAFFETFNPKSQRLTRDSDWLISLGSAVRDQELVVLPRITLIRRVGDPQSANYHSRQRGKRPRVRSRTLAQLLIYGRKLIWPIFVYIPNGLRFFRLDVAHLFVLAMIALWIKNVANLATLPTRLIARLSGPMKK